MSEAIDAKTSVLAAVEADFKQAEATVVSHARSLSETLHARLAALEERIEAVLHISKQAAVQTRTEVSKVGAQAQAAADAASTKIDSVAATLANAVGKAHALATNACNDVRPLAAAPSIQSLMSSTDARFDNTEASTSAIKRAIGAITDRLDALPSHDDVKTAAAVHAPTLDDMQATLTAVKESVTQLTTEVRKDYVDFDNRFAAVNGNVEKLLAQDQLAAIKGAVNSLHQDVEAQARAFAELSGKVAGYAPVADVQTLASRIAALSSADGMTARLSALEGELSRQNGTLNALSQSTAQMKKEIDDATSTVEELDRDLEAIENGVKPAEFAARLATLSAAVDTAAKSAAAAQQAASAASAGADAAQSRLANTQAQLGAAIDTINARVAALYASAAAQPVAAK